MRAGILCLLAFLGLSSAAVSREQSGSQNPVYPGSNAFQGASNPSSAQDHQPSASTNFHQSLSPLNPSSNGNSYYYSYIEPKQKDQAYQGAASNQQFQAANPEHDMSGTPSDLSYGQEMNGNLGSALHEGHGGAGGQGGGAGGYDVNLANLAAHYNMATAGQGQGQGGPGGPGGQFNPAQFNGNPAYPTGNSFDPSAYGHHGQGENAFAASSQVPGYHGQPMGYVPAGGAQAGQTTFPYGGQHFGNYASGSSQSNSYEPSTGSRFGKYGLGSIIMPMLALAGLSLLIPTVTSLSGLSSAASSASSSRRKRSVNGTYEPGVGGLLDRMDRYYSMYKMAVEKETCMNRIICQLGDAVSDVKHMETLFTFLDKLPSSWTGNKVKVFKKGAFGANYSKCKQYTC